MTNVIKLGKLPDVQTLNNQATTLGPASDYNTPALKAIIKDCKAVVSFINSEAKRLQAPYKEEIEKIKSLSDQLSAPYNELEQSLRNSLKEFELEKERIRQDAARKAASEAERVRQEVQLFAKRRNDLEANLIKAIQEGKKDQVKNWLETKGYKAEAYGSDAKEVEEYFADLLTKVKADTFAPENRNAELEATFAAAMVQQASEQAAPQKSAGTHFKEVYSVEPGKEATVYTALLVHFLATGGSMDKLDFLLRWAEKTKYKPAGIAVEKIPIVRV